MFWGWIICGAFVGEMCVGLCWRTSVVTAMGGQSGQALGQEFTWDGREARGDGALSHHPHPPVPLSFSLSHSFVVRRLFSPSPSDLKQLWSFLNSQLMNRSWTISAVENSVTRLSLLRCSSKSNVMLFKTILTFQCSNAQELCLFHQHHFKIIEMILVLGIVNNITWYRHLDNAFLDTYMIPILVIQNQRTMFI